MKRLYQVLLVIIVLWVSHSLIFMREAKKINREEPYIYFSGEELFKDTLPYDQPYDHRPFDWPTSTPEKQGLDSYIFLNANEKADELGFMYSLLVIRNGYLIAEQYFNGKNKYYPFNLWSTSKSVIGALIGIALKENYLTSIDQKMMDFFPEYITPGLDPRKYDITIRHLLQMRAGYPDESSLYPGSTDTIFYLWIRSSDWMKFAIETPLEDDPGQTFHYSTPTTHILSGIITKATGISALDFAKKYLFDPLDIPDVGWNIDPQGYHRGGWDMYLTSRDMARFGYLYLNNGLVDGKQIVPVKWVEDSLKVYSSGVSSYGVVKNWGYGYQWDIGNLADYHVYYRLGYGGQLIFNIPGLNMIIVTTASTDPDRSVRYTHIALIYKLISYYILSPVRNWLGPPPYSPSGLSGMTVENRSLLQLEYLNVLKWQPSPRNEGVNISKYRIYQVQTGEEMVLLGETDANRLEYWHRKISDDAEYTYGISSVTADNKESVAAIITVR